MPYGWLDRSIKDGIVANSRVGGGLRARFGGFPDGRPPLSLGLVAAPPPPLSSARSAGRVEASPAFFPSFSGCPHSVIFELKVGRPFASSELSLLPFPFPSELPCIRVSF